MAISLPHDRKNFFTTAQYWNAVEVFFKTELQNDGEDITAEFYIPPKKNCIATIIAKSEGILAGQEELIFFLEKFFPKIAIQWEKKDGESILKKEKIISFSGNARQILKLERVFLNTLSRMSGIATMTKKIAALASPTPIAATRKTQWSYLDKKAVSIGGGLSHRIGLFDAILVKENHLLLNNGDIRIAEIENLKNTSAFLEIEVETEEEFTEIFTKFSTPNIQKIPKVIMLDNFSAEDISALLKKFPSTEKRHKQNIFLEASGGITEQNIQKYSTCGVDVISLGVLTHSVMPLDFSLRVIK